MRRSVAILLACAALACSREAPVFSRTAPVGEGGGAVLMRNLLRAKEIEIVVSDGPLADACGKAAALVARERTVACSVRAPGREAADPRTPRIVVAAAGAEVDALALDLLGRIGVEVGEGSPPSFKFLTDTFDGPTDALVAVFEDPGRPGLPVTLLYGNDATSLARHAEGIDAGWKPFLRIYRADALAIEGPLWTDGSPHEPALADREPQRIRTVASYRTSASDDPAIRLKAAPAIGAERREAYLASVGRAKRETLRWTGGDAGVLEMELVLHARPERLAECVASPSLSSWNAAQKRVHALVAEGVPDDSGYAVARLVAEQILGPASEAWIADGAAVHASGNWWGTELEGWIAWLRLGGLVPGLDALVDPDATRANSRHLVLPMRAALFRFLLESRGEAFVRSLWKGSATLAAETETEKAFVAWLDELAARHRPAIEICRPGRKNGLLSQGFLTAVGIEESGAGAERGFGSEAFERSLADARAIGARCAVLTCFLAAERDLPPIADLEARFRDFEPFESDLRVFCGLAKARASGMLTVLQPRLLNGPAGTLAGTDPQGSEIGWQRFFDVYSRFAVHVGLLAELAGAHGLVLGGGMTAATNGVVGEQAGTAEHARWRSEGWEMVLRTARGAYAGCLTWAADSVADAQVLSFWSELDAVGCDLDPGIDRGIASFDPKPGVLIGRRIESAIGALEDLARGYGKPLILTRAGFRPGAPRPGRPAIARSGADPGMQALGLEVLGNELKKAATRGALRGVVLWRWSSDPEDDGATARDVVLRRGPAREAAAKAIAGL